MTDFIKFTDVNGKTVLINKRNISLIEKGSDGEIIVSVAGERRKFREDIAKLEDRITDKSVENISSNLLKIWEILRARL